MESCTLGVSAPSRLDKESAVNGTLSRYCMTARTADESKLGSYVIVPVGTGGYGLKIEGYATSIVRELKLLCEGYNLSPSKNILKCSEDNRHE